MLYIFLGYLFAHFHITINDIELLPKFIGYILIYVGVRKFESQSWAMEKAKPWAGG